MGKGTRLKKARPIKVGPYQSVPRAKLPPTSESTGMSLGSDIRQSDPVLGICALCLHESRLLLSHIEPKWANRAFKASGEGEFLHTTSGGNIVGRMQDGSKHYLLCTDCEQYLGKAENYLRQISFLNTRQAEKQGFSLIHKGSHEHFIENIDHALMSRALLGIALKVHFSTSHIYEMPNDKFVRRVRCAVLKDDYQIMPTLAFGMKWMKAEGISPQGHITSYFQRLNNNVIAFSTKIGGIEWIVFLNNPGRYSEEDELFWNRPHWMISVGDIRNSALLLPDHWESYDGPSSCCQTGANDPCPCDSQKMFGECCQNFWCLGATNQ